MNRAGILVIAIALTTFSPLRADGPLYEFIRTIDNPRGASGIRDRFGESVAVQGERVLIGANKVDVGAKDTGAAYLFDFAGNLLTTFPNPTPEDDDWFGENVAFVGENVLIGARNDNTGGHQAGAAYLFQPDGQLIATLLKPDPLEGDQFGARTVRGIGDIALVACTRDGAAGKDAGGVYLYSGQGEFITSVVGDQAGDAFGRSVALVGSDRLLIGAYAADTGAEDSGAAYLFDLSGNLLHKFVNPTPQFNDLFGISVAAVGDRFVVGADNDATTGKIAGSAYLFDESGNLLQTILNPTPDNNDWFAWNMAPINDTLFAIPAIFDDTDAQQGGAVYIYDYDGNLVQSIFSPEPDLQQHFGHSVAAADNLLWIAGDHADQTDAPDAVYMFRLVPEPSSFLLTTIGLAAFGLVGRLLRNGVWTRRQPATRP